MKGAPWSYGTSLHPNQGMREGTDGPQTQEMHCLPASHTIIIDSMHFCKVPIGARSIGWTATMQAHLSLYKPALTCNNQEMMTLVGRRHHVSLMYSDTRQQGKA